MRILGEKSTITVSLDGLSVTAAYKLPNKAFYCVSIKDSSQTYYKVHFSNSQRARMLTKTRKKEVELIEVPVISTDNGKEAEKLHFYKEICVREYEAMLVDIEAEETAFINSVSSREDIDNIDPSYFDDEEAELALLEAEFDDVFQKTDEESMKKAKNLLTSLAKFYLDAEMIDKNDFLKHKLEIEKDSVAGLILQLDMSKQGIKKLMRKIYIDRASIKSYEALAKLQRIVLDVNESLSRLIKDSVSDMKDIKGRFSELSIEDNNDRVEDGVVLSTESPSKALEYLRAKHAESKNHPTEDTINTENKEDE